METIWYTLLLLTLILFLHVIQIFFNSIVGSYFALSWCSSHFKTMEARQYSFHKLTQFSQGNIVLDPPASNTDSFLTREIVLLLFT
jgi:hypothetical protein